MTVALANGRTEQPRPSSGVVNVESRVVDPLVGAVRGGERSIPILWEKAVKVPARGQRDRGALLPASLPAVTCGFEDEREAHVAVCTGGTGAVLRQAKGMRNRT